MSLEIPSTGEPRNSAQVTQEVSTLLSGASKFLRIMLGPETFSTRIVSGGPWAQGSLLTNKVSLEIPSPGEPTYSLVDRGGIEPPTSTMRM